MLQIFEQAFLHTEQAFLHKTAFFSLFSHFRTQKERKPCIFLAFRLFILYLCRVNDCLTLESVEDAYGSDVVTK